MNHLGGSFITTGSGYSHEYPVARLFSMCKAAIEHSNRVYMYGERLIRAQPGWVRDHALTMKGFRYWETDLTSFIDLLLKQQTPSGFFFEIIAPLTDGHSGDYGPDSCCLRTPENGFGLARLELEADVEYLMVDAVHMVWQSTGDVEYVRANLPRLEKALRYITSDPKRWDLTYRLVKRPRTIDTWDFIDRATSGTDRSIRPDDPMGIMHGDNTGLYRAEILLAAMYRLIGEKAAADVWENEAAELRERINCHLWNGRFYKHFLRLDDTDYGVDETWQLSLSNAYDLNRGTVDFKMARSIIDEYRSMRTRYGGTLDDFRSLEPPYPTFHGYPAGEYVNGTVAPFVAGQLALGAFEFGEERYGADILKRMAQKISKDGKLAFLYDYSGKDIGGGPGCWCGAELLNALSSGLAGVCDNGALFKDITISPRWVAADETTAHVRLEYGPSKAFVEYHFEHDPNLQTMKFTLLSSHEQAKLRLLLPKHAEQIKCRIGKRIIHSSVEMVGESRYVEVAPLPSPSEIEINYTNSTSVQ